jgi:hypothetical protein
VILGKPGSRRRGNATVAGEKHKPVIHAEN